MSKQIYTFKQGYADGSASMSDLLGGKGAHLAEMASLGLPVPHGVTIPTTFCAGYYSQPEAAREGYVAAYVDQHLMPALWAIEQSMGYMPLLAVRSGSKLSMPGMMDTLLNVGMSREALPLWTARLGENAALDCYQRFIAMYAETALGQEAAWFKARKASLLTKLYGLKEPPLTEEKMRGSIKHMRKLVEKYETRIEGVDLSLRSQLVAAVVAVCASWFSPRAVAYRKKYGIADTLYTAVTIQAMVFGNRNEQSCSGVLFTRCPATGNSKLMGEFLPNAQGEDVVAGTRTPLSLEALAEWSPSIDAELRGYAKQMEQHYGDMQDMEFTVENGRLWVLQTRTGKRSTRAKFRIAHDLLMEGVVTEEGVASRISGDEYFNLSVMSVAPEFKVEPTVTGFGGSVGVGIGKAVFTSEAAIAASEPVLLIREETAPSDVPGMDAAAGILTSQGGQTSHAAVVARAMNKPCVVGITAMTVYKNRAVISTPQGEIEIPEGAMVSICGSTGRVWVGTEVPVSGGADEYAEMLLEKLSEKETKRMTLNEWALAPQRDAWVDTLDIQSVEEAHLLLSVLEYTAAVGGAKRMILDLSRVTDMAAEENPLHMLAGPETPQFEASDPVLQAMIGNAYPELEKQAVVVLPERLSNTAMPGLLRTAGWSLAGPVKTVGELMSAKYATLTPEFFTSVGGEKVANELLEILKAAGRPVAALPEAKYKSRLVYEVFRG